MKMKTIEEAAREFCNIKQDLVINERERYYQNFQKYDGFKAGAEYAQRWISINEELPFLREYCLVKLSDGTVMYAQFSSFGWVIFWYNGASIQNNDRPVTHWRKIEIE